MSRKAAEHRLREFDEQHCVISIMGKTRIFSWEPSDADPELLIPAFSTETDMKLFYGNEYITMRTAEDETKRQPLFPYWLRNWTSPRARGLTLEADGGRFVDGRLNLWQGLGVEPKPGEFPRIKQHVIEVICSGNRSHARYLVRWIAWCLQNPTRPAEVAVVLRGRKGTGKGKLARLLCRLFGAHALQISSRKHLVGDFNRHLLHCCFLYADEALWPGDKSGEGSLKRMVTEPTLFVEPKGIDGFEVRNRLSIMMTSNEDWVVPASTDERRFACFDVSDAHRQDFAYFAALDEEVDNGGAEAFLHAMLNLDLKGWHPRQDVPATQSLADQQIESASPQLLWLGGILGEGALPCRVRDAGGRSQLIVHSTDPSLARSQLLWLHARASDPRLRYWSEPQFWKFLDQHGITKAEDRRSAQGRFRRFPPLDEARSAFRKAYSWWPEFDNQKEWEFAEEPLIDPGWAEQHEEAAE